jgi:DNA-binding IclR family transcriptional regulator
MNGEAARTSETSVLTLRRGLAVLDAFCASPTGLGVNEIARKVALHKSTVSRLCATLEQAGYLERDQQAGKYRLGARVYRLVGSPGPEIDLRHLARPILRGLVDACGETAHMVVREGSEFVKVEVVDGSRSVRTQSRVGQRSPAHASAMGKAILAHLSPDEVKAVLGSRPLPRLTPNTITARVRLDEQFAEIREQGYSVDVEEFEDGLRCVGAPIFDADGQVVAAISISGPRHRFSDETMPELANLVRQSAEQISARLGAPAPQIAAHRTL